MALLKLRKQLDIISLLFEKHYADMAELADAHGSGPCEGNFMEVRVLLSAPKRHSFPQGESMSFSI